MGSYQVDFILLILGIIKLVNGDNCLNVDSVVHRDKYMERQVFRKVWRQSLYTCASECLMSSACLSFGFDKKTGTCLLNSNSSDTANIVDRTGFLFSDIQHWPKSLSGRCAQRICPNHARCEVTRQGLARCGPEFQGCGRPPDVRAANTMYDGHYQGAVATYSCDSDYRACYNNVTSTCQSSGAWESLANLCGQFRWHNPQIAERHSFPCGPTSRFKLKIRGTPTGQTRWGIWLRKDHDVLAVFEFRFLINGIRNEVIVNSLINGEWGEHLVADDPLSMTVGQETEVQITLHSGIYRLEIDGVSVYNFTERLPGGKSLSVSIEDSVTARLMEIQTDLN